MKPQAVFLGSILTLLIMVSIGHAQQDDFPTLSGPYLGQKPPGEFPVAFAPSIVSLAGALHGCIAFTPDGKEVYWIFLPSDDGQRPPAVNYVKLVDGRWTKPGILEFSREYGPGSLNVSPDGTKLYFSSRRPWPESWGRRPAPNSLEAFTTWVVERSGSGWGEPKPLERRINRNLTGVSSTVDGTLYTHGIRRIRLENGRYTEWEELGPPLNVGRIPGGNPCISPDESYILFNRKIPGQYGYGIFVSYRTRDDRWTGPVNLLGRIGAPRGGSQPLVTPDGKYVFYYADGKFYWMDAKIIDDLKPKGLKGRESREK